MIFSSLEDLKSYVEKKHLQALEEVGEEMKDIMKKETTEQVYHAYNPNAYETTGQLLDSIDITDMSKNSVTVEWQDNGDWTSVNGEHFFPMYGLESGKTWGEGSTRLNPKYRPKTNLLEESINEIEREIPNEYRKIMNGLGVPVR